MNLSENLKKIRKEKNLSQEELAEKLNVSRQSVSKWESGQAYPEMDKMLQLCEMFNLNIDDLLNRNINEVNSKKKSKINLNKYIDSFFDFITKTVKMFASMTFKQKLQCIFEQIFLVVILVIIAGITGSVLQSIIGSLISFLPGKIYYYVHATCYAIFKLGFVIIGSVIILHIFKIRYLNYYEFVHEENKDDAEEQSEEKKENLNEPKEKIIIRDPKHSEYGFIKGLVNIFIFIIKIFAFFAGFMFIFSLIGLATASVLAFAISKTGILFLGLLIAIVAAIAINIVFLVLIYQFMTGRERDGKASAIIFLISLLLIGVGIGLMIHGTDNIKEVNIYSDTSQEYFVEDEYTYDFEENLVVCCSDAIEYHESDRQNVLIKLTHYKNYDYELLKVGRWIMLRNYSRETTFNGIKTIVKDLNKRNFVHYENTKIDIYTSKENIEKLKINYENFNVN